MIELTDQTQYQRLNASPSPPSLQGHNTTFAELFPQTDLYCHPELWLERLNEVTAPQVERALQETPGCYRPSRLMTLLAPAARDYLEVMARQAHDLTLQRFGRTVTLFAPMYLSNYCNNLCTYCGFSADNPVKRRRLSLDEAEAEAALLRAQGFTDLLLVSSEDRTRVTVDYLCDLAARLRPRFSSITIEIQQLEPEEYQRLLAADIDGVTFYQETYDPKVYQRYHLSGPKADYARRLRGPDHMARVGMRRLGLGVLLGLAPDWRWEVLVLGQHAHHLMHTYWRTEISFSFPRLRPASHVDAQNSGCCINDRDLVQMLLALRLCFSDAGLVLSTREAPDLRDALVRLGVTRMSAGSTTNPGGYALDTESLEQFAISDHRSPAQIAAMLRSQGFEAVWKNWM